MAKNFLQQGDTVTIVAPRDVVSGELVTRGMLSGVAQTSALSGAAVEIATRGVYTLAKTSAQAWTVGAAIYTIPGTGVCTTATTAGNVLVGVAMAIADNPSDKGIVRLNGSMPAAAA
jgi:predicted RecA/RadA family phage recombinase